MGFTFFKRPVDKNLLICILVSSTTAFLTFAYFIFAGHGTLFLFNDFTTQQITFSAAVQTVLKEFKPGEWCWNLDLGSSLINGFSFYKLGSIFFWLSVLFPKTWFPYLIGWIYILKYIVASVTAYLYLGRFVRNKSYGVVGALLYAFSGFQSTNLMFYHFHDVVAFFPLLLLGVEKLMGEDKEKGLFAFAVFINCLLNYFFFVQEVVFLILYFLFRFWGEPITQLIKRACVCLLWGALGVGMASILFIPSIIYIRGNPQNSSMFYLSNLVYNSQDFLSVMKGFLFPAESMAHQSALFERQWRSTSCFLPLTGLSLVFAYIAKAKKDWIKRFIIFLFIVSFSPLLQGGFLAFTLVYQRWWYMLILMMALASIKVLDRAPDFEINKYIILDVVLCISFYISIKYIPWSNDLNSVLFDNSLFLLGLLIAIAGPIALGILLRVKLPILNATHCRVIMGTMLFCILTTGLTIHYYQNGIDWKDSINHYTLGTKLQIIDEQYRYNTVDNTLTLTGKAAGIGCFSSTIENSSRAFDTLFDHYSTNSTGNKDIPGLPQLLAGKHFITKELGNNVPIDEIAVDGTTYYVIEGNACPIGFAVKHYIVKDALLSLETNKRAIALLNAVVINADDIPKVQDTVTELSPDTLDYENGLEGYVSQAVSNSVQDFSRDTSGFYCTSVSDDDSLFFFSVPYDKGWSATIDGAETDVIDTCGMMAITAPSGVHTIEFTYHTPGLRTGIIISLFSWVIYIALLLIKKYARKRK